MNRSYYIRISHLLFVLGFLLLIVAKGAGQSLTIGGGNKTLTITTGIADGLLTPVTNATGTLTYTTPRNPNAQWRITVSTTCAGQSFGLSVVATNVTKGTAAAAVILTNGGADVNFITAIPRQSNNATCTLNYTASARFDQGNSTEVGNDVHTVKYTLLQP
jgi:hypothetical protein